MDSEFARTFLAIAAAGNFVGAAERLHVTRSTVSGRIQTLEEQLGCRLFTRDRVGAVLTDASSSHVREGIGSSRTVRSALTIHSLKENAASGSRRACALLTRW